jgi:GH15 family glucan-1,4-alpha-glucosidase
MRHLTIQDYGVISNHFSMALISRLGSVDWCCFPYLDSPSHFSRYSDQNQGGRFQISPQGSFLSKQQYLSRTQILETRFETPSGKGTLSDWMPLSGDGSNSPMICRKIVVLEGTICWVLHCTPRFQYGLDSAQAEKNPKGILFRGSKLEDRAILQSDFPLKIITHSSEAIGEISLDTGQSTTVLWMWGRFGNLIEVHSHKKETAPDIQTTIHQWRKIAHKCPSQECLFGGPWHELVSRSGLILKSLSQPYAGSIAQSATVTPSVNSHGHFWDQRYATLRNGAFLLQALYNLGYTDEARAYFSWVQYILQRDGAENLQPVYLLDGSRNFPNKTAQNWIPFESQNRLQLDIYGHWILILSQYFRIFGELPEGIWPRAVEIADYISQAWRRPDHGPWNDSIRPEHWVVSKLFCWKVLQEICWLSGAIHQPISPRWLAEKINLHSTICTQGFDPKKNSFIRAFGGSELDSSSLWMILLQFLPVEDARIQGTLHAIQSELSQGIFIRRTRPQSEFQKEEPHDLLSSLQFTTCLALSERREEAIARLAELCTYANPLGLMGNQIGSSEHPLPERFPCVYTHTFLVNCALYLGAHRLKSRIDLPLIGENSLAA